MYEHIRYSEQDGIAHIVLDRPAKKNAITAQMFTDLRSCWDLFNAGPARAAILSSALPDIFSAGADLMTPPGEFWHALPEFGFHTDKPIIAAVNGKAIGVAFVLVSMCDFIVMSEEASLIYPEAKIGVAKGAVSMLVKRMPLHVANEVMMLGDPLPARRAYDVGFVNRIAAEGQHLAEAERIASTLRANSPLVIEMLKRMSLDALGDTPIQSFARLSSAIGKVGNSQDAADALEAFRSKTKPVFHRR